MKVKFISLLLFITLSFGTLHATANDRIKYQEINSAEKPASDDWIYLQVMLGNLETGNQAVITDPDSGEKAYSDFPSLPFGGIQAQIPITHQWFEYGFETGAYIGWKNDKFAFVATNNQATLALKNELFMLEVHGGVFAALAPTSRFRIYVGAGPVLAYGHASNNDDEEDPAHLPAANGANIHVNLNKSENDVDIGYYGRAGVEYFTRTGFSFGAGVRHINYDLDFGQVAGKMAFDDELYFITLGQRFKIY
jgi:opacity protein-like surface antigen